MQSIEIKKGPLIFGELIQKVSAMFSLTYRHFYWNGGWRRWTRSRASSFDYFGLKVKIKLKQITNKKMKAAVIRAFIKRNKISLIQIYTILSATLLPTIKLKHRLPNWLPADYTVPHPPVWKHKNNISR